MESRGTLFVRVSKRDYHFQDSQNVVTVITTAVYDFLFGRDERLANAQILM
jgi:hypothetical protein